MGSVAEQHGVVVAKGEPPLIGHGLNWGLILVFGLCLAFWCVAILGVAALVV